MRIALLSILDRDPGATVPRPAFASFAGAMVVERQLDLALKLGCERVACLVDAVGREVVELQHRAETAGMKFRAIRRPSRLSGMVTSADEVLVIGAGVLPDDNFVEDVFETKGVLAFDADLAVPLGYERIDLELAWSGVMLIPGRLVERLSELPSDVDVPSALMRIALQAGTRVVQLDRNLIAQGKWHLNADRKALDLREKQWIDAQRRQIAFRAPGLAIAERAGARLARDIVGRSAQPVSMIAGALSAFAAIVFGLLGYPALGLVLTGLAALFGHMGGVVERIARFGRPKSKESMIGRVLGHAIDPLLILLLIIASPAQLGVLQGFVPLILFGLLRLGERYASDKWRATYADRIVLGFLLGASAFTGHSIEMSAAIALLALATRFFAPFRRS